MLNDKTIENRLQTISDTLWEYMTPEALEKVVATQADALYEKIEATNLVSDQQKRVSKLKALQPNFCKNHCKSTVCHCHERENEERLEKSKQNHEQNFKCSPEHCNECTNILC